MISQEIIQRLVEDFIAQEYPEHYIVDIAVHPGNRIVVELGAKAGIGIDDCVRITKHIEANLNRDEEDYELEVGSAGLTSPFKVLRQYQDAIGQEIELLLKGGIKERGTLRQATSEEVELMVVRKVKLEGAKRKTEVEESLKVSMDQILQAKRLLSF